MAKSETVKVVTSKCMVCNQTGTVEVPRKEWETWNSPVKDEAGLVIAPARQAHIQDAFPALSADEREQMISGTHGPCWDKMFCTCSFAPEECEVNHK